MELTLDVLKNLATLISEKLQLDPPIVTDYAITAKGAAAKAQEKKAVAAITKELVDTISNPEMFLPSDMPNLDADTQAAILALCPDQKERLCPAGVEENPPEGGSKKRPGRPAGPKKESKPKEPKKTSRGTLMTKVFLDGVTEKDAAVAAADKASVEAGWKSNVSEAGFQYNKVKEIFAAIESYGYKVVKA